MATSTTLKNKSTPWFLQDSSFDGHENVSLTSLDGYQVRMNACVFASVNPWCYKILKNVPTELEEIRLITELPIADLVKFKSLATTGCVAGLKTEDLLQASHDLTFGHGSFGLLRHSVDFSEEKNVKTKEIKVEPVVTDYFPTPGLEQGSKQSLKKENIGDQFKSGYNLRDCVSVTIKQEDCLEMEREGFYDYEMKCDPEIIEPVKSKAKKKNNAKVKSKAKVNKKPYHQYQFDSIRIYTLQEGELAGKVKSLSSHIRVVNGDTENWICAYCCKEFPSVMSLQAHTKQAHNGEVFRCDQCEKRFERATVLAFHLFSKHRTYLDGCNLTVHACQEEGCSYQTCSAKTFAQHKQKHARRETVACQVCDKKFKTNVTLKNHVETVHMKINQVACDICQKVCYKNTLNHHKKMKHGGGDGGEVKKDAQQCPVCGVSIKQDLNLHMIKHHKNFDLDTRSKKEQEKRFACSHEGCSKVFLFESELRIHNKKSHQKSIPCPRCDKKFSAKQDIRRHVLNHHLNTATRKPLLKHFSCKGCDNTYVSRDGLGVHIANKHLGWPIERANREYKILLRTRPELYERLDIREEENTLLRGLINDEYLHKIT